MYTFDSRVRYSETDPDGFLKIESLLDYLQDCSTFQSEDLGIGISFLKEQHWAWLVNYWQIDILRLPVLSECIRIGTSPYELKGFMGQRNFMIETISGERLVNVNSVWSLMNMDRMLPVRVPEIMLEKYELFPRFDMEYAPRKINVPAGSTAVQQRSFTVDENMLDSNHHVNNAQYVRLAMEACVQDRPVRRLRVEYRRQALLGDHIVPSVFECAEDMNRKVVSLDADDGRPYAVLEVTSDKNDQNK